MLSPELKDQWTTELLDAWVYQLESGNYQQTTFPTFHENNRFCPVGVCLDIIDPGEWDYIPGSSGCYKWGPSECTDVDCDSETCLGNIPQKIGLSHEEVLNIAELSDSGMSFTDVARWLRDTYGAQS